MGRYLTQKMQKLKQLFMVTRQFSLCSHTEDKLFKITLLSVALCVLTITGIIMCITYYKHMRKTKQAFVTAVRSEVPEVDVTYMKRTQDNSYNYNSFSNLIPVLPEDEDTGAHKASIHIPLTLEDYAKDPKSGITLNPPIFYMQL
ncbi:uncharacterized protein si:dkey-246e1.3 isoform X2 [Triplophysa rosa]|uniref:uncharacterized protein si:dkey-246e1.3 isoform X2 n=1 Tax=Triplophysa rosa TaxID=992332 RepID=UPI002545DA84|nr:uncharacterized protein si:dkey-246e1.3 isoform X2 [Triplophysa rosa]